MYSTQLDALKRSILLLLLLFLFVSFVKVPGLMCSYLDSRKITCAANKDGSLICLAGEEEVSVKVHSLNVS